MTTTNTPITTAFEWLWTAIAVAGILVQLWLLRDSRRTKRAAKLDPKGNGRRGRAIHGDIRTGHYLLCVHAIFTYFGARALTLPNAPLTWERGFNISLFVFGSLLLVGIGWGDRRDRIWIRDYPDNERRRTA